MLSSKYSIFLFALVAYLFFFSGNSKILEIFGVGRGGEGGRGGGEVILKFKPKVFGKYIVILGVVRYDFISTYIALCNL